MTRVPRTGMRRLWERGAARHALEGDALKASERPSLLHSQRGLSIEKGRGWSKTRGRKQEAPLGPTPSPSGRSRWCRQTATWLEPRQPPSTAMRCDIRTRPGPLSILPVPRLQTNKIPWGRGVGVTLRPLRPSSCPTCKEAGLEGAGVQAPGWAGGPQHSS